MSYQLTSGALRRAFVSNDCTGGCTVQILEVRAIKGQERYRLVLNDGDFYQQGMLTTQLNHLVSSGQLKEGTVVKLQEFLCSQVSTRKVIIVLNMTVVGHTQPIGAPQNVEMLQLGAAGGAAAMDAGQQQAAAVAPFRDVNNKPTAAPSAVPSYLQKPPASSSSFPASASSIAATASGPINYHPISSLNPYQNRWTIKARVTAKSDVRLWHNARGEGKLFSVDLLDAAGGQIRATMFNDAVDKFDPLLRVDGVYVISKGQLKLANKKFSRVPNEYEITLNSDAEVQYVQDDGAIEQQRFVFSSIEEIGRKEENEFTDVIGVVQQLSPIASITSKTNQRQLQKRSVLLCDRSQLSVEVTLWGEQAEKYNESVLGGHPILAIKNAKVSNFGGKTLGTTFQSQIFLNPDRPEAHALQQWWTAQGGSSVAFNSLSQRLGGGAGGGGGGISSGDVRRPLSCIKDEQLGFKKDPQTGETKGDFLLVKATITAIRHDFNKPPWYFACPNCNKKVTAGNNDDYWCEKCNKSYPSFECRYILSVLAADSSSSTFLNVFNEQAVTLLSGVQAKDALAMQQSSDEAAFNAVFTNALFRQWLFKVKVKAEMQQEEMKARCNILAVQPIDFRAESNHMLAEIERM